MSARVTRTRHDRSGTAAITAWRSAWAFSQALIVDRRASRSLTDVPIANVLGITRTAARDRPAHDRLPRHTEALNHAIEVDNPIAHARDAFAVFHAERVLRDFSDECSCLAQDCRPRNNGHPHEITTTQAAARSRTVPDHPSCRSPGSLDP